MKTPPNQTDEPKSQRAMIGGVWVPAEAYEYHERERHKLIKELADMSGRRDMYKYLCIGLAATILLVWFLNGCVPLGRN